MSRKSSNISSDGRRSGPIIGDIKSASSRNYGQQHMVNNQKTVSCNRYDSYRVKVYGSAAEKETQKQQVRAKLQEQVKEKDALYRKQLVERVAESDQAVALDQKSKLEDTESRLKKAAYLKKFSDGNKKIMEEKEKALRSTKEAETELEKKLLEVNPINWNMTLH